MTAPLLCRRNLDFLLNDWLMIADDADPAVVTGLLDLSERLATEAFLSHYKRADVEEPRLVDGHVVLCPGIEEALSHYRQLGLFSAGFPEELGGLGLPHLLCMASFAFFAAANVATAGYPMLTVANARLITTFGSAAQIDAFARPQIAGRWFGTMCLSEPQAGSSLGDIATRANREGADDLGQRFRLTGNKMWISGGDHALSENIVHLVLAKIPDASGALPSGTAGISLFIVPKYLPDGRRNDVRVAGLNHKMGYRGTVNCLLNFGEREGAVGWLVGAPGQGLRQMFQMMNEARIGVGIGAAALGYRGHMLAVRYAQDRVQGRPAGVAGGSPIPIIEHADVKHMLRRQQCYVEGALALCLYGARLVDHQDDPDTAALLALLTPIIKTWSSEQGLVANDLAIQIHGGYGYTRDFDVERLWRDNRLNPIHEGTTGIQAIDLVGRKILRDGNGVPVLAQRIRATVARAGRDDGLAPAADTLARALDRMLAAVAVLRQRPGEAALDDATLFLRAMGHLVVGWLILDQAVVAAGRDADIGPLSEQKRQVCRYYDRYEMPFVATALDILTRGDSVIPSELAI